MSNRSYSLARLRLIFALTFDCSFKHQRAQVNRSRQLANLNFHERVSSLRALFSAYTKRVMLSQSPNAILRGKLYVGLSSVDVFIEKRYGNVVIVVN